MCVSLGPAKLSSTIILASAYRSNGTLKHVMGYQNRPQSEAGPNAMLLPIPAVANSVTPENLILTEDFPYILQDMAAAIPHALTMSASRMNASTANPVQAVVFDHGLYTIVLAQNAAAIPLALEQVPEDKCPPLNTAIFNAYSDWYPNWAIALCCFNNADFQEGQPILLTYEPIFPNRLFCPALDSHTGDVPDLKADVSLDHALVLSAQSFTLDMPLSPVSYRDDVPAELKHILPDAIFGTHYKGKLPNGDWWFDLDKAVKGHFDMERIPPPFS